VELVSANATDLSVVAAARVSNGVGYGSASKGEDGDRKLIRYLLKHDHGTPFEHNVMTFFVTAPIFVVREWHRHRIGWSYNEVSGRYTELDERFYLPAVLRAPAPTNKQGSIIGDFPYGKDIIADEMRLASQYSFTTYRRLLRQGVARELARIVLPLNTYTSFYATCNARSLMHFLRLRLEEGAQWEIRQYAAALEKEFAALMPVTHQEWERIYVTSLSSDSSPMKVKSERIASDTSGTMDAMPLTNVKIT
jgi:thymidylate synthase (FAD)